MTFIANKKDRSLVTSLVLVYVAVSIHVHIATAAYSYVCEHGTLTLSCGSNSVLSVSSANYGRTTGGSRCPHSAMSNQQCRTGESTVKNVCNGRSSCSVPASNSYFGDPCVGTYKYLEATYSCSPVCTAGQYIDNGCRSCPAGRYSTSAGNGQASCPQCPAGKYGSSSGLTSSSCTGSCSAGHYCPAGSTSSAPNDCPAGKYGSGGSGSIACSGNADPGYWTVKGADSARQNECPAGRYGLGGSDSSDCSGTCTAGYYCPAKSDSSTKHACGGANKYCETAATAPTTVSAGYFSTPTSGDPATRTGQSQCTAGKYCSNGVREDCPAGRYGSSDGETSSSCSGQCTGGFFCAAGSISPTAELCGTGSQPQTMYCPPGTTSRKTVTSGYYTTPESAAYSQRSGQAACPSGYTCVEGLRLPNLNWNAPCSGGKTTLTIGEDASSGAAVDTVTAQAVTGSSVGYSIASQSCTSGAGGNGISNPFTVDGSSGAVTTAKALDFEVCRSYDVALRATADGDSITCSATIALTDSNERPFFNPAGPLARSVEEDSPRETIVNGGAITVDDPDNGQSAVFSITGGNTDDAFRIGACSGELSVNNPVLDAEGDHSSYTLEITVTDDGVPPLSQTTDVVVTILNKNDAPQIADQAFAVDENSVADTFVGNLVATDAEDGADLTYTVSRAATPDAFKVDSGSKQLLVKADVIDYEAVLVDPPVLLLDVTVTDSGGLSDTAVVTVTVRDVNEAPTLDAREVPFTVREDAPDDTILGQVTGTDQDAGDSFAVSLADGNTGNAFAITDTGVLSVADGSAIDYETVQSYTLELVATDNEGASSTRNFVVNVIDVNEAPIINDQSRSIGELAAISTNIGAVLAASDPDTLVEQALFWNIIDGDPLGQFGVLGNGQLVVRNFLNFENVESYSLVVQVSDNGAPALASSATISVSIVDENEPPTVDDALVEIDELSPGGTAVSAAIVGNDVDAGDTALLKFSITGGTNADWWAIDEDSGLISFTAADGVVLDADDLSGNVQSIDVTATDPDTATGTGEVRILIRNIDDPPVIEDQTRQVGELAAVGSAVGLPVVASDEDLPGGEWGTLSYSILDSSAAAGTFEIHPTTGQITVAGNSNSLTFPNSFTIDVQVADGGGESDTGVITVEVADQNFAPSIDDQAFDINENVAPGTEVASSLGATDPDEEQTLTYSMGTGSTPGVAALAFDIAPSTGRITVSDFMQLDHEQYAQMDIVVVVTDDGNGELRDSAVITITINDVNEAPTLAMSDGFVDENSAGGTTVLDDQEGALMQATDPDADDNVDGVPQLAYSMVPEVETDIDAAAAFEIDSSTGVVSVRNGADLDFEERETYSFVASAEDARGLRSSATFTININNVNEPMTLVSSFGFRANESDPIGTVLGSLSATDPDAASFITWTIVSGNVGGAFSVDEDTGVVRVAAALDYENDDSYTLVVDASDNGPGTPILRSTTVTVAIENVDDVELTHVSGTSVSTLNTLGGDDVTLHGSQLGPTEEKGGPDATFLVKYGPPSDPEKYTATNCVSTSRNDAVTCETVAGIGRDLVWSISVSDGGNVLGTAHVPSTATFAAPIITSAGDGTSVPTSGGTSVTLTGSSFGPAGTPVDLCVYGEGLRYDATDSCTVVSDSIVECSTIPGVGSDHEWRITIGGVTSAWSGNLATTSYSVPSVDLVVGPPDGMATAGGDTITIFGSEFGPLPDSSMTNLQVAELGVEAWYGSAAVDRARWYEASCTVTVAHETAQCTSVTGVGSNLQWLVRVGGQFSVVQPDASTLSYTPPAITSIYGEGTSGASTGGGDRVFLFGTNFGPAATVDRGDDGSTLSTAEQNGVSTAPFTPPPEASYGLNAIGYAADDCRVTVANVEIMCFTVEGTGKGHAWTVTVGGQTSDVVLPRIGNELGTSYNAPSIASFEGPGAAGAETGGGQLVRIRGNDFGRWDDRIQLVVYDMPPSLPTLTSDSTSEEIVPGATFLATACTIVDDHVTLECETVPGVGKDLEWTIRVDGQNSTDPVTDYGTPVITQVNANDVDAAHTDGGTTVTLMGENFGPPGHGFLVAVTYGPTGSEYSAVNVRHVSHTEIECETVPGFGERLSFRVAVGNQVSEASSAKLSYARPAITSLTPSTGPTEGGTLVTVVGTNFAQLAADVLVRVRFGNAEDGSLLDRLLPVKDQVPLPGADMPDDYVPRVTPHQFDFIVPEGIGAERGVAVSLFSAETGTAITGSPIAWNYEPPALDWVFVNRSSSLPLNTVSLTIYGKMFGHGQGEGVSGRGDDVQRSVLVQRNTQDNFVDESVFNGEFTSEGVQIIRWTHTEIEVWLETAYGNLFVEVVSAGIDGTAEHRQRTRTYTFTDASVALSARVGANSLPSFRTEGYVEVDGVGPIEGSTEWIESVLEVPLTFLNVDESLTLAVNVSDLPCPLIDDPTTLQPTYCAEYDDTGACIIDAATEWTLRCKMPPGQGPGHEVTVMRNGQRGGGFSIDYIEPEISSATTSDDVDAASEPRRAPTTGFQMTVTGTNFGVLPTLVVGDPLLAASYIYSAEDPEKPEDAATFISHSHTELVFIVPDGEGTGVVFTGRAQGWVIGVVLPGVSPVTLSNELLFRYEAPEIDEITWPGGAPTAGDSRVYVNGRNFGAGSLFSLPSIFIAGVPCTDVQLNTPHTELSCASPAGTGASLNVRVVVSELSTTTVGGYSYDPPVLSGFAYVSGDEDGELDLVTLDADGVGEIPAPTVGGTNVTVFGSNFGTAIAPLRACVFTSWAFLSFSGSEALRCNGFEDFAGEGEVPRLHVYEHSDDRLVFRVPHGMGRRRISLIVGGQTASGVGFVLHDAPEIVALTPDHGDTVGGDELVISGRNLGFTSFEDGVDFGDDDGSGGGGTSFDRVRLVQDGVAQLPPVPPLQHLRIDVHYSLHSACITGALSRIAPISACSTRATFNSGIAKPLGANTPLLLEHTHDTIRFRMLGGIGVDRLVTITLFDERGYDDNVPGGVVEGAGGGALFTYNPPVIQFINPNSISGAGGTLMQIHGDNFGLSADLELASPAEQAVFVAVGELVCDDPHRLDAGGKGFLQCTMPETVVGYHNVSITVAGQNSTLLAPDPRLFAICKAGQYGQLDEYCLDCPQGAECAGDTFLAVDAYGQEEPRALSGWYNLNTTCTEFLTGQELERRQHRGRCNQVLPCEPLEACIGDNNCAEGYRSVAPVFRCNACAEGYYKLSGECIKCPEQAWIILVGFGAVALVAIAGAYWLNKKNVNVAFVSIGVDYLQVLALFAGSKVAWPDEVKRLFELLSVFNLNLDITAPECSIPNLSYTTKWYFIEAFPLVVFAMLVVAAVLPAMWKLAIRGRQADNSGRRKSQLFRHVHKEVATALVLLYFLYLYLSKTVLDVFNCAPTQTPDGSPNPDSKLYLQVVFEECGIEGGVQMTLLPWAILAFFLYTMGYPAFVARTLFKHKMLIKEDQLLRAMDKGQDHNTNRNAYDIRKRYEKIYYHFKPDYHYWILCVLLRKVLIAFASLMFNRNTTFLMATILLVLFIAYAAQVRNQPYMSPQDREQVLADHEAAAAEGHPVHVKLRTVINASKQMWKKKGKNRRMSMISRSAAASRTQVVGGYLTNYNTVEATLLFASVFVALCGVMFESSLLEHALYEPYKLALTYLVMTVIAASLCYFFFVLGHEIRHGMGLCRPKAARHRDGAKSGLGGGVEMPAMADVQSTNPYFSTSPKGTSQAIKSGNVPTPDEWQRLRLHYEQMQEQIAQQSRELQSLKGNAVASPRTAAAAAGRVRRKEFEPRRTGSRRVRKKKPDGSGSVERSASSRRHSRSSRSRSRDPDGVLAASDIGLAVGGAAPQRRPSRRGSSGRLLDPR